MHWDIDRVQIQSAGLVNTKFPSHFTAGGSPSFFAISSAVFLSRSIIERKSVGVMY